MIPIISLLKIFNWLTNTEAYIILRTWGFVDCHAGDNELWKNRKVERLKRNFEILLFMDHAFICADLFCYHLFFNEGGKNEETTEDIAAGSVDRAGDGVGDIVLADQRPLHAGGCGQDAGGDR